MNIKSCGIEMKMKKSVLFRAKRSSCSTAVAVENRQKTPVFPDRHTMIILVGISQALYCSSSDTVTVPLGALYKNS